MPKYWGKQIFSLGSFPEVGQKQKTERKRKKERLNDGNNNGQLPIANATSGGARKAAWAKILTATAYHLLHTHSLTNTLTIHSVIIAGLTQ